MSIILASQSPRRKELLSSVKLDFKVIVSDYDEIFKPNLNIEDNIVENAYGKAKTIFDKHQDDIVIGCDTMVVYNNHALGKPKNRDEAFTMLKMLSNQTHRVISGVAILSKQQEYKFYEETYVTFYPLSDELINTYLDTNEYVDKAGSYGIQGIGKILVKEIKGDYYNVVGLPISKIYHLLSEIKASV